MTGASGSLSLTAHLGLLSSISFGGFPTVLPDLRNFVVATHGWMTDHEFTSLFAMAQSTPGPNMILMMSFIGWKIPGGSNGKSFSRGTAVTAKYHSTCKMNQRPK